MKTSFLLCSSLLHSVLCEGAKNNILFIVVDDLRPQLNKAYGQNYMITPNLDRLASWGVVFDHAYAQIAHCSPSRNSFMTGRFPANLQLYTQNGDFRNPNITGVAADTSIVPLPEYFVRNGYLTLGGGKVYHPGGWLNNDVGKSWSPDIDYFELDSQTCASGTEQPGCGGCATNDPDEHFFDWKLANHTIHSLRYAKNQDKPFFIAAGFFRPHAPWYISQRFVDMYANVKIDPPQHPQWPAKTPRGAFICGGDGVGCDFGIDNPRSTGDAISCRKHYYASVTSTDHYIGLILDELDNLGLTENTAVVVFGDHGWHLGEGNQWAKYANTEFATRVPLIIRAPWLLKAGRSQNFVELVDLYPTVAEIAGLPTPGTVQGESFLTAAKTNGITKTSAVSIYPHCCWKPGDSFSTGSCGMCGIGFDISIISYIGFAVRTSNWRYVEWYGWDGQNLRPRCENFLGNELYPHEGDTGLSFESAYETKNMAEDVPSVVPYMQEKIRERFSKSFAHCASLPNSVLSQSSKFLAMRAHRFDI